MNVLSDQDDKTDSLSHLQSGGAASAFFKYQIPVSDIGNNIWNSLAPTYFILIHVMSIFMESSLNF